MCYIFVGVEIDRLIIVSFARKVNFQVFRSHINCYYIYYINYTALILKWTICITIYEIILIKWNYSVIQSANGKKEINQYLFCICQTYLDTRGVMICIDCLNMNLNRMLLLAVGLWPYQQSKLVQFQLILFFIILITCIIFQVYIFKYIYVM